MNTIWSRIKGYLNIEPDPEAANIENHRAVKLILLTGMLNSLLLIMLEKNLYGYTRTEMMIGCGIFAFLLMFSFINWSTLKDHITIEMEVIILLILVMIAFVDYNPGVKASAFLFPILLVVLPPMIFEKPWKLLLMVLIASVCGLAFNARVVDDFVRARNIIEITSVTFLSCVFTCYFSHARCMSVHMRKSTQVVADHDPLTGIYNRGGGTMLIRDCVERHESGTFMIIDIDDFKLVNDHYGHQKGDDVLKAVARLLQSSFKQTDIVMRMGGDEFIIYALGMVDYNVTCKRLEQLCKAIHSVIVSREDGSYVTVSIGGAVNDGSYPDYETLYKAADQYLYQTKARGKDGYSLLGTSFR